MIKTLFAPYSWFDYSTQSTDAEKQTDAIENIRYYFAHVFNDVSGNHFLYLFQYRVQDILQMQSDVNLSFRVKENNKY